MPGNGWSNTTGGLLQGSSRSQILCCGAEDNLAFRQYLMSYIQPMYSRDRRCPHGIKTPRKRTLPETIWSSASFAFSNSNFSIMHSMPWSSANLMASSVS
jgi:hypothetical protein